MKKLYNNVCLWVVAWSFGYLFSTVPASAAMPWETPIQRVVDSISGPVAKMIGVIVIVLAGLGLALGESGSGVRKLFQVVLGLGIAFSAASIIGTLFQSGRGV